MEKDIMTKQEIKHKEDQLLEMTKVFCSHKLDNEYFQLCKKLIKKLGRKRDVPFQRGRLENWAAAVVYTIGTINLLFDKSFEPYMTTIEISEYFGTKSSTVSNKAREILTMFKLSHFSPEFSTQQTTESNPFNSMVRIGGFVVPIESLPEDLQRRVKEARANGRDIKFHIRNKY